MDSLSPREVALRLADRPGLSWLDGGLTHGREGRYSFVACDPVEIHEAHFGDGDPLQLLANIARPAAAAADTHALGLREEDVPCWIGHIAYDAHAVQRARFAHVRDRRVPVLRMARYDALYAFDHERGEGALVGDDEAACARLEALLTRHFVEPVLTYRAGAVEATDGAQHQRAIVQALVHVRDGDVYEINLARRFVASFEGAALGLYLRMREQSPVPLGYFAQGAQHAVLGRSMERFLRYRHSERELWTSPIKGTIARRGDDAGEAERLRRDEKEHAEHAMVVDLMRNDLSRVCEVGSVEVRELMTVLPFAGLSHLISTVGGRVREGVTLEQLVRETFPPGSVTGTPKERALEIIEALEPAARGVYTGAVGFIDRAGGLSLAVAIRTATVCDGEVSYFAGGGIVWGSDPARETAETELKARVFLDALALGQET